MIRDVSVREVMNGEFVGASEGDGVVETVELLVTEGADVAVVMRGNEAVGMLTERDVLAALVNDVDLANESVEGVMTERLPSIRPDRGLHEARDRMSTLDTSRLVVLEGDEPRGVITEHDLLAGSTMASEPSPTGEGAAEEAAVVGAGQTAVETDVDSAAEDAFDDQGICEVCGALTADLAAFNGQLRCADCRDV